MTSGEAGLGAAICIDGMIPQELADRVVFRPFAPALVSDVYLAWRKNATLSPASSILAVFQPLRGLALKNIANGLLFVISSLCP